MCRSHTAPSVFIVLLVAWLSAAEAQQFKPTPDAGLNAPPTGPLPAALDKGTSPPTGPLSGTEPNPSGNAAVCLDCDAIRFSSRWYAQADALFWQRVGDGYDQVAVIDINAPPGEDTLLRTDDLTFDFEPGVRFLVGYRPDACCRQTCCSAWEFSYFTFFDAQAGASAVGEGNLAIPGDLGLASNDFYGADRIELRYRTRLHNFELNCVKSCCQCCQPSCCQCGPQHPSCRQFDFLVGVRYLILDEAFSIVGTDLSEGTGYYDIDTDNDLLGLQLGGRLRRTWQRWAIELTGKGGVFLNWAKQSQRVTDYPDDDVPFVLRDLQTNHGENAAMLGEIGVTLERRLSKVWALRVGYNVLGITGVALAPDQLDFTDTFSSGSGLEKDGSVFIHGAHVGLEARR